MAGWMDQTDEKLFFREGGPRLVIKLPYVRAVLKYKESTFLILNSPSVVILQCARTVLPGITESNQYLPLTA